MLPIRSRGVSTLASRGSIPDQCHDRGNRQSPYRQELSTQTLTFKRRADRQVIISTEHASSCGYSRRAWRISSIPEE